MADDDTTMRGRFGSLFSLQGFVVVSILSIFAMAVGMLMFKPMPLTDAAGTLLTSTLGALTGAVVSIVSFYFGSSSSSRGKDETIAKIAVDNKPVDGKDKREP